MAAGTEEKVGGDVEGHAVEQVHDIGGAAGGGETAQEVRGAAFEGGQVADAVAGEHGPEQGAAVAPAAPVGGEDAVAQERLPQRVEPLPLAEVAEPRRQHRLDVLRVPRQQVPLPGPDLQLDTVRLVVVVVVLVLVGLVIVVEEPVEVPQELVASVRPRCLDEPYCSFLFWAARLICQQRKVDSNVSQAVAVVGRLDSRKEVQGV